jgi:hypothetical protein
VISLRLVVVALPVVGSAGLYVVSQIHSAHVVEFVVVPGAGEFAVEVGQAGRGEAGTPLP